MKDFTIVITTFSKRYEFLIKLISQIRRYANNDIIIIVNGEKDGSFDNSYRKDVLNICAEYNNVYPNFFIETRGLCKLWNTGIITSPLDDVLILNDDIEIHSDSIFKTVMLHINSKDYNGITKINNTFSHFVVNKELMDKVGYFDERLLGFGEEDGDITYRLLKMNIQIGHIYANDLINIISNIRHEHIKAGIGKYSSFNRDFIYEQKYQPNTSSHFKGMFDSPMEQMIPDIKLYPYEDFFRLHKHNL